MEGEARLLQAFFILKDTWNHIRSTKTTVPWDNCLWFSCATPKYQFCTWLALHDRLSTGARMYVWNTTIDGSCVQCHQHMETRDHLFFSCSYSATVLSKLARNLMGNHFSTTWSNIVIYASQKQSDGVKLCLTRYVLQETTYSIWRERNTRKHGDTKTPSEVLFRNIDRLVKNRTMSLTSPHAQRFATAYQAWIGAVP